MTVGWAVTAARSYTFGNASKLFDEVFEPVRSINETLDKAETIRGAQLVVSLGGRATALIISAIALLGVLLMAWRRRLDLTALMIMLSPGVLLLLTAFGGETLFRIFLFAAPGLVYFAAYAVRTLPDSLPPHRRMFGVGLLSAVTTALLLPGFLLGYFGKDQGNYFRVEEIQAAQWVGDQALPNSVLVVGNMNYPRDSGNYENVLPVDISAEPILGRSTLLTDPARELAKWLDDPRYSNSYILITRSEKISNNWFGPMPPGSVQRIEDSLRTSQQFDIPVDGPTAVVFTLKATF
jgi:hypothetical protein